MPISQGSAGGLPGMNLKAWALVNGDGTIIKSSNITSFLRTASGKYTVTFTNPMAGVNYFARGKATRAGFNSQYYNFYVTGTLAAGSCNVEASVNSNIIDLPALWEFFE